MEKKSEVIVKRQHLTHVKAYTYLGLTIIEQGGKCMLRKRIKQARDAFWQKSTILTGNISIKSRIRFQKFHMISMTSFVLSYGCVSQTFSKAI